MEILKKIYRKLRSYLHRNQITNQPEPVYTKHYFKDKKFLIGEFTYGKPKILFENEESNLIIGKYCSIAENVTIFLGGNHRTDWVTTYPFNIFNYALFKNNTEIIPRSSTKGSVFIGNDVWIGFNVTILSGVKIGNGAVVAAGSMVSKDIGAYEIWGGNPAKLIKKRFNDSTVEQLEKIAWWNWESDLVLKNVSYLCSENVEEFINTYNEI